MWQQVVLGIHANGTFVKTSITLSGCAFERIEIALTLHHLERMDFLDAVFTLLIFTKCDKLKTDSIVKSLLIHNECELILFTGLRTCCRHIVLLGNHIDGIPTLGNCLFPKSYLLGNLIVIGRQLLETHSLFGVELVIVVVQLTLHGVVRSDGGDRVLDNIYPTLRVALLVLGIVKGYDVVLEQAVNSSSVKLILIALIIVGALLGECPSGTFTIAFQPPSVEHGKVDHTIHLSFFARST